MNLLGAVKLQTLLKHLAAFHEAEMIKGASSYNPISVSVSYAHFDPMPKSSHKWHILQVSTEVSIAFHFLHVGNYAKEQVSPLLTIEVHLSSTLGSFYK